MDPVQSIAGKDTSYSPLPTMPNPVANGDAQVVGRVVSERPYEKVSVKEGVQDLRFAVEKASKDIEHFISSMQRQVRVARDSVTGYIQVQVVDPASGEVVRTLPSEELLRIARSFETLGSVMVNQRA